MRRPLRYFFAQPDKPEQAIMANPEAWYGGSADRMGAEAFADYKAVILDARVIHGMIEDYRAGLSLDHLHDADDRKAGRRVQCPTMVLWSMRDDLERLYGDVLGAWRPWTTSLQGKGIACGHHMAEEAPQVLAAEILAFLRPLESNRVEPKIQGWRRAGSWSSMLFSFTWKALP